MRCVEISTSDDRMDCRDMFYDPINPLPKKCPKCGFPDLDYIPQPYFLVKSRTMSPNELAGAENGNFFVRERVRQVLDILAPGQCTYFPTTYKGTTAITPWLLTVPNHQVATAKVDPSIPRCETCGEPRSAHPGTQWSEILFGKPPRNQPQAEGWTADSDYDVFKSATWGSSEKGWDQWISRDLYLSVRFLHLLKKIKAKGFYEATCQKPVSPDKDESAWIKEKFKVLESAGIRFHADGTLSDEDAKWLRSYIKTHSCEVKSDWDVKATERRVKAKLPKSYLDFISLVGPKSFDNIDEQDGFTSSILPPNELESETGYAEFEDEESKAVNAVTFASTDHGDCFCFDVQKGKKEYAIVLYKHEGNFFESYAENFAACIKRFAGQSDG
ncbi:MAG: SMI1/KNR4 family protein [Gemmataceae bacterium]